MLKVDNEVIEIMGDNAEEHKGELLHLIGYMLDAKILTKDELLMLTRIACLDEDQLKVQKAELERVRDEFNKLKQKIDDKTISPMEAGKRLNECTERYKKTLMGDGYEH